MSEYINERDVAIGAYFHNISNIIENWHLNETPVEYNFQLPFWNIWYIAKEWVSYYNKKRYTPEKIFTWLKELPTTEIASHAGLTPSAYCDGLDQLAEASTKQTQLLNQIKALRADFDSHMKQSPRFTANCFQGEILHFLVKYTENTNDAADILEMLSIYRQWLSHKVYIDTLQNVAEWTKPYGKLSSFSTAIITESAKLQAHENDEELISFSSIQRDESHELLPEDQQPAKINTHLFLSLENKKLLYFVILISLVSSVDAELDKKEKTNIDPAGSANELTLTAPTIRSLELLPITESQVAQIKTLHATDFVVPRKTITKIELESALKANDFAKITQYIPHFKSIDKHDATLIAAELLDSIMNPLSKNKHDSSYIYKKHKELHLIADKNNDLHTNALALSSILNYQKMDITLEEIRLYYQKFLKIADKDNDLYRSNSDYFNKVIESKFKPKINFIKSQTERYLTTGLIDEAANSIRYLKFISIFVPTVDSEIDALENIIKKELESFLKEVEFDKAAKYILLLESTPKNEATINAAELFITAFNLQKDKNPDFPYIERRYKKLKPIADENNDLHTIALLIGSTVYVNEINIDTIDEMKSCIEKFHEIPDKNNDSYRLVSNYLEKTIKNHAKSIILISIKKAAEYYVTTELFVEAATTIDFLKAVQIYVPEITNELDSLKEVIKIELESALKAGEFSKAAKYIPLLKSIDKDNATVTATKLLDSIINQLSKYKNDFTYIGRKYKKLKGIADENNDIHSMALAYSSAINYKTEEMAHEEISLYYKRFLNIADKNNILYKKISNNFAHIIESELKPKINAIKKHIKEYLRKGLFAKATESILFLKFTRIYIPTVANEIDALEEAIKIELESTLKAGAFNKASKYIPLLESAPKNEAFITATELFILILNLDALNETSFSHFSAKYKKLKLIVDENNDIQVMALTLSSRVEFLHEVSKDTGQKYDLYQIINFHKEQLEKYQTYESYQAMKLYEEKFKKIPNTENHLYKKIRNALESTNKTDNRSQAILLYSSFFILLTILYYKFYPSKTKNQKITSNPNLEKLNQLASLFTNEKWVFEENQFTLEIMTWHESINDSIKAKLIRTIKNQLSKVSSIEKSDKDKIIQFKLNPDQFDINDIFSSAHSELSELIENANKPITQASTEPEPNPNLAQETNNSEKEKFAQREEYNQELAELKTNIEKFIDTCNSKEVRRGTKSERQIIVIKYATNLIEHIKRFLKKLFKNNTDLADLKAWLDRLNYENLLSSSNEIYAIFKYDWKYPEQDQAKNRDLRDKLNSNYKQIHEANHKLKNSIRARNDHTNDTSNTRINAKPKNTRISDNPPLESAQEKEARIKKWKAERQRKIQEATVTHATLAQTDHKTTELKRKINEISERGELIDHLKNDNLLPLIKNALLLLESIKTEIDQNDSILKNACNKIKNNTGTYDSILTFSAIELLAHSLHQLKLFFNKKTYKKLHHLDETPFRKLRNRLLHDLPGNNLKEILSDVFMFNKNLISMVDHLTINGYFKDSKITTFIDHANSNNSFAIILTKINLEKINKLTPEVCFKKIKQLSQKLADFKKVADEICDKNYILFAQQGILLAAMRYSVINLGNLLNYLQEKHFEHYQKFTNHLTQQIAEFKNEKYNTELQYWRLELAHEFDDNQAIARSNNPLRLFHQENTNPQPLLRFYEKEIITPEQLLNLATTIEKCIPHYGKAFELAKSATHTKQEPANKL